jgi:hypothetical protein
MANTKPVIIKDYEYSEFAHEPNTDGHNVIAIYGVDDETLKRLDIGTVIEWHDEGDNLMGVNPMKWNGEVYATFEDFVIVYLY